MHAKESGKELFLVRICAAVVIVSGGAVLAGRALDMTFAKGLLIRLPTMKPNTALGLLLCGVALASLSRQNLWKPVRVGIVALVTEKAVMT